MLPDCNNKANKTCAQQIGLTACLDDLSHISLTRSEGKLASVGAGGEGSEPVLSVGTSWHDVSSSSGASSLPKMPPAVMSLEVLPLPCVYSLAKVSFSVPDAVLWGDLRGRINCTCSSLSEHGDCSGQLRLLAQTTTAGGLDNKTFFLTAKDARSLR